jgi:adenylate kinase
MLNLIIFGAPGSGKGTQAINLSEKYNLKHLSTGKILRQKIEKEAELEKKIAKYLSQGNLVPDKIVIEMVKDEIKKNNYQNFIFDGFPRTIQQAKYLDKYLEENKTQIDLIIVLKVPKKKLISRLLDRAKKLDRDDDSSKKIIKNRLSVYQKKTHPLIKYYKKQGKLIIVDGVGDIKDISEK